MGENKGEKTVAIVVYRYWLDLSPRYEATVAAYIALMVLVISCPFNGLKVLRTSSRISARNSSDRRFPFRSFLAALREFVTVISLFSALFKIRIRQESFFFSCECPIYEDFYGLLWHVEQTD